MNNWKEDREDAERAREEGVPFFRDTFISVLVKVVLPVGLVFIAIATVFNYVGGASQVAQDELGARALLDKYTWFKEAAAQCDAKRASIKVLRARITELDKTYGNTPRTNWPRSDLEQRNLWSSEVAGVTASYNDLAAQYNAKMVEIHWRFTNQGSLPAGASEPLPREFKPYAEE